MAKKSSGREKMSNKTNKKMSSASSASRSMSSTKFEKFSTSNGSVTCCNGAAPSTFSAVISIILLIIILLININASMWIAKLEKLNCACSDNFMRNYIKYFLFVMIPAIIVQLFVAIYMYSNNINSICMSNTMLMFVGFSRFIFGIFYIINICIAIIYINRLKELNCECSEDIRREVYWIYNIILAAILCIYILMLIVLVLIVRFTNYTFSIRIPPVIGYIIILIIFVSYLIFYYQNLLPK